NILIPVNLVVQDNLIIYHILKVKPMDRYDRYTETEDFDRTLEINRTKVHWSEDYQEYGRI
ncbi:MAG: hypothetical protein O8C66_13330, partial [Candidatus Methanoperedens sp.]|nr:hypothetical protein [Candidatus Methanoperedens sp.]